MVELEEAAKNLVAGERVFPSVGREDGAVEGLMCIGQPGGKLVVEIGEGAVLNLGWVDAWRVEPCVANANEFTGGVGYVFDTRVVGFGGLVARGLGKRKGLKCDFGVISRTIFQS